MNLNEKFDVSPGKVVALLERMKRLAINAALIEEGFSRGGGKGGQKVNKTSNRVQLSYPPLEIRVACQRERKRSLQVIEADGDACLCEGDATTYVIPGTPLTPKRKGKAVARGEVGELPPVGQAIVLEPGDRLDMVLGDAIGRDAVHDDEGAPIAPAMVGCALAEVFGGVRLGQRVFFDDGRIA